ncbi:unnamed protein product, partial [Mesorhabditis belari]|uniref:Secreted protein n=1 Tax=Mesorhabditis belari TaxID=2138241 RepID=A0AAF3J926_9BILA
MCKCLLLLLCILFPPLAVLIHSGCDINFCINILFTFLAYVPELVERCKKIRDDSCNLHLLLPPARWNRHLPPVRSNRILECMMSGALWHFLYMFNNVLHRDLIKLFIHLLKQLKDVQVPFAPSLRSFAAFGRAAPFGLSCKKIRDDACNLHLLLPPARWNRHPQILECMVMVFGALWHFFYMFNNVLHRDSINYLSCP